MIRLLHIADAHLDTTFAGRAEHRALLQASCRAAFARAVEVAVSEAVDVVLIAGDLFDNDRLTLETELFLVEQLRRLDERGIPVVYVTGNHDPGSSRHRSQFVDWPTSVTFIKGKRPETVTIEGADGHPLLYVTGAGHLTPGVTDNLAASFPVRDGDLPHVGVLHTMVRSARQTEEHDSYAPCGVEDLERTGYDYWALGHIHVRQEVSRAARAWYSGNLIGRSPRETGPKGGNLVDLMPGREPVVRFVPLADVQWAALDIHGMEACATTEALRAHVVQRLKAHLAESADVREWFVRVNLIGPCPVAARLRDADELEPLERRIMDDLGVRWIELRTQRLVPPIDMTSFRGQQHVLAEALDVLDGRAEEPGDLAGILESWANEPDEVYLRELLADMDVLIAERFIRPERSA